MSKLSKRDAKLHNEAMALVRSGRALTEDEQALVLDQFQEGATHMNGLVGAFFTPRGLARDFVLCDFTEREVAAGQGDLFTEAA